MAGVAPALAGCRSPNDTIRLGVVGIGGRGRGHLRDLGYGLSKDEGPPRQETRPKGVEVVAVCDVYAPNLAHGLQAVAEHGPAPKTYTDCRRMLDEAQLDAVLIATPDHVHAPIAIAAAESGCDAYVEKCMSNDLEQAKDLGRVLERTGRIIQVGHQSVQDEVRIQAAEVARRGHLGDVHVVRAFFQRNTLDGAWIKEGMRRNPPPPESVAWEQFLGPAPKRAYDPRRFFEWRCYWDYSTGISGDIFSHEIDSIQRVLGLGIPVAVTASGGVYRYDDGRETPDVYTTTLEYPDKKLSVVFQASLASSYPRHTTSYLGTDATMEVGFDLRVFADRDSVKYAEDIASGKISPGKPFMRVTKADDDLVWRSTPTSSWLEGQGLTTTSRDGKTVSTTRLHQEEFFDCMRTRKQPSASFARSFDATVACHMGTVAYKSGRTVGWDAEKQQIV